jgi:RND family efflux transporter MFP subunit
MRAYFLAALCAAAINLLGAGATLAHEGHDPGAAPKAPPAAAASRAEATTEQFELVAVARSQILELYLHDAATNAPIADAELEIETPSGPVKATVGSDQVYRLPAPFLAKPGQVALVASVTRGQATDLLPLSLMSRGDGGPVTAAPPTGSKWDLHLPQWVLPAGGFVLGLVVMAALRYRPRAAMIVAGLLLLQPALGLAHEGEDHSAPAGASAPAAGATGQAVPPTGGDRAERQADGSVFVPKATQRIFGVRTVGAAAREYPRGLELPGRVIPDPNASGFVQSAVGGRLSAPEGGFPRLGSPVKKGDVLAYVTPPLQAIDISDMRQRQGEIDQQMEIVKRRLARYEQLAPTGAVARSQLEDTRSELEGLKDRRAALENSRRQPESLVAPVAGIVADGGAVAGQMAQPNAVIFHIIDTASLWVEALSFEPVSGTQTASAVTSQGKSLRLTPRGSGFADRNQTIPVHFAIESADTALRAGQFVTVLLTTWEKRSGIAVPRSALVRGANGVDLVLEKVSAERFVPRIVRTEPLDGENVLISAGLEPGKRIVSRGAELIDHIR